MKVSIKTNNDKFYFNCQMLFQSYGIKAVRDDSDVTIIDAGHGAMAIPKNATLILLPTDAERLLDYVTQLSVAKTAAKEKDKPDLAVPVVLQQLGVPVSSKGYRYLTDAILLTVREPDNFGVVTKQLYPVIAKKYDTTYAGVERCIRYAIDEAWHSGDPDMFKACFGYNIASGRSKPTSAEFIAVMSERFRINLRMSG